MNKRQVVPENLGAACHECAHAIVCLALGRTFQYIRLRDEERPDLAKALGATAAFSRGQMIPTDERAYRGDALVEAMISLAGPAFEKLRSPHRTYFAMGFSDCSADFQDAEQWCTYHVIGWSPRIHPEMRKTCDEMNEIGRMQRRCLREARRLIQERWDDVLRLGKELVERRELTQAEVETLIGKTPRAEELDAAAS